MFCRYFIGVSILFTFFSCQTIDQKTLTNSKVQLRSEYVYLENDSFKIDNKIFFPKIMNYIIHPRMVEKNIIFSPSLEYDDPKTFDCNNENESEARLRAHFKAIKMMGFNSLRLVGMNDLKVGKNDYKAYMNVYFDLKKKPLIVNDILIGQILDALEKVITVANKEGLKVMLLLPKPMKNLTYTHQKDKYVSTILKRFSEESTIFSYDFFNEPVYFDNSEFTDSKDVLRDKLSALELVKKWKSQVKKYAPYQLFTISFAEPIEVFEWDPSILPIDFVSIHTYHPLRVPNEIYWFSKYIGKPWLISETSLPADNDSITYQEQSVFMKEAFQRVINCGGIGFGWWQYQDVEWGPFEHNYTPLISSGGKTKLDSNNYILGSFKDAANVLPTLKIEKNGDCDCHVNYFNMMGYKNYKVKGKVLDLSGAPIEGAVIRGWNKYWSIGMNTFTNHLGEFNLYSNDECIHFEVSAPGYTRIKFTKRLQYLPNPSDIELENVGLEYHNNHYQWYIDSVYKGKSVFKFDKKMFDNNKVNSSLGVIKLEKLAL